MAGTAGDSDHDDIRTSPDGRQVAAEVSSRGQGPPQRVRMDVIRHAPGCATMHRIGCHKVRCKSTMCVSADTT